MVAGTLPHEQRRNYYDNADCFVKLPAFRAWGESLQHPFTFPDEFPRASAKADAAKESDEPMNTKERNTLLRVIAALAKHSKIDTKGGAAAIAKAVELAGFDSPKERAIRDILKDIPFTD